jgi:phage major head subunit gpT-like protein
MGVVSSDIPLLIQAGLKTIFMEEVKAVPPSYEKICTVVPTTLETQNYGWLGSPPSIREFIDERVGKGIAEYGYSLKDKTWEATIAVDKRAIENDQYGQIMLRVRQLARSMITGVNKRAWTILREAGADPTSAGYLGGGYSPDTYNDSGVLTGTVRFASAAHVYRGNAEVPGSQSNLNGTAVMTSTLIWTGYSNMISLQDDRGEIMGDNAPTLLITAPAGAETASQLLSGGMIVPAANTSFINTVPKLGLDLEICPYWASDGITSSGNHHNWMLANTSGIVKPLILQVFTPAANGELFEFSALEGTSENGFMRDKYYYGIRGRWEIGYGNWQTISYAIVA